MIDSSPLDRRPILIAIAGPNGAGQTTFYHAHLRRAGLRFVNPDDLARELDLDAYAAARVADGIRHALIEKRESFVFETLFSDPVGEKLGFLKKAAGAGYTVALCFIGISSPDVSRSRVAMRVSQGEHDVPDEKIRARFPRILANLACAVRELPYVLLFDNEDLRTPFREIARFRDGKLASKANDIPRWARKFVK